uniref:Uncharacterized protein n=1 Tax=Rhizophora mucronata TaxID=61149 RepID=A0A2P2N8S7_RHIMU
MNPHQILPQSTTCTVQNFFQLRKK